MCYLYLWVSTNPSIYVANSPSKYKVMKLYAGPIRHDGPLDYTEQKAPCHRTVRQGIGAKEAAVSGVLIDGEHREGL